MLHELNTEVYWFLKDSVKDMITVGNSVGTFTCKIHGKWWAAVTHPEGIHTAHFPTTHCL